MAYLIVFLGAGIGGALRHGVNMAAARLLGFGSFPAGTLTVNVLGSLTMGVFAAYFGLRTGVGQHWRLFFTTGLLGGFTTFSAFSLDTVLFYERGHFAAAGGYAFASVVLSVAALFAGMWLVRLGYFQ